MKLPTTARGCELHVTATTKGQKVVICKMSPTRTSRVTLSRLDARAVADAIHDVLEAR